ncbi:MAG: hypothetical protein A3D41_00240 [Candidatus Sungbacteria bacterium RIFCSPHIGHO2_02_FULL_41_12b]|nr:MAG: hypothetical protein A3D41_00240 [Candidatus Sungbacteria bacterium RIFCSPHIGHO2_02_FULL_41_12b]
MNDKYPIEKFAPLFQADEYSAEERLLLSPFFTNLDKSVYVPLILAPELIGALCSRTSRTAEDLRLIYLREFVDPFINPVREEKDTNALWEEKVSYGKNLKAFIEFLKGHSVLDIFSNPKARAFYIKWLAEYGDDSIAQMAGGHLIFWGLSQLAIKHFEDQRIALAPIEKSTRYVDYSKKIKGHYLYYTDPTFEDLNLKNDYEMAMDGLFDTYTALLPRLIERLSKKYPEEKPYVLKAKAFDTLRGLLPVSTLSQVSFFGNGQSFEHMISRSLRHSLGEIRWAGERALEELNQITPSFLRRVKDDEKKAIVGAYQEYLANKGRRVKEFVPRLFEDNLVSPMPDADVKLVEYDSEGESKIIAGILYSSPNNHRSWDELLSKVSGVSREERRAILAAYLDGRAQRWQKVGRAFENAYVRFEITMNIGAWRDLHRHRMLTQMRQNFSCFHGYDLPQEVIEAGFEAEFRKAIERAENVFSKIFKRDEDLAQYAATFAHRLRFMQWENLRECFWEMELRTIPEGHPDYRHIEQKKFKLVEKIYPLIAEYMLVNMGEYDFARRGQEEKIQKKMEKLL